MWLNSWSSNHKTLANRRSRTYRLRLEALEDRWLPSTLTVLNNLDSGPGSLRAEIAAAKSGDTIVFASTLDGQTITLTSGEVAINKSLDIEGPGGSQNAVGIGTNDTSRIFDVTDSSTTVKLAHLNVQGGLASQGGGIFDAGATVTLDHVDLDGNLAVGAAAAAGSAGGDGLGAAIYQSGGTLNLTACNVEFNFAEGVPGSVGSPGGAGLGGAIYAGGGTLTVANSYFYQDAAIGANGLGSVGKGLGGAIYAAGTTITVAHTTFDQNSADGFVGFTSDIVAAGGAIYAAGGTLTVTNSTLTNNIAVGNGIGGTVAGGGIYATAATVTVSNSLLSGNVAFNGGDDFGGGIYFAGGTLTLSNDTFVGDRTGFLVYPPPIPPEIGIGGALYIGGGTACISQNTTFSGDFALTSNPDVFGPFTIC
jgi:hypothetical protein